ncbi:MAG: signal peptidase II [Thermodesulfobacteriota bacterium]
MRDGRKYVFVAAVAAAVVLLDQLTKLWVDGALRLYQTMHVFSWLNLTYVRNTGAAFSLFADQPAAFRIPFFLLVALLAGGALLFFVRQTPASHRSVLFACGLVLGGAVGNFIDRVLYGAVIDFVDVHWRGMHWPAFNVADSGISVGVALLLLRSLFVRDESPAEPERSAA